MLTKFQQLEFTISFRVELGPLAFEKTNISNPIHSHSSSTQLVIEAARQALVKQPKAESLTTLLKRQHSLFLNEQEKCRAFE